MHASTSPQRAKALTGATCSKVICPEGRYVAISLLLRVVSPPDGAADDEDRAQGGPCHHEPDGRDVRLRGRTGAGTSYGKGMSRYKHLRHLHKHHHRHHHHHHLCVCLCVFATEKNVSSCDMHIELKCRHPQYYIVNESYDPCQKEQSTNQESSGCKLEIINKVLQ